MYAQKQIIESIDILSYIIQQLFFAPSFFPVWVDASQA